MKQILLVILLIILSASTSFDITSSSVCTNYASGFCTRWQQNGTVQQQLGSCFPGNARVMTPNGPIMMEQLKKGDSILALVDGQVVFTEVTSWFHHDMNVQADYLKLYIGEGFVEVSRKHNIAVDNLEFKFAEEVLGDKLYAVGSVAKIQSAVAKGKYSPKTRANNYFVYVEGTESQKILAHCFAHIRNPQKYETIVSLIESAWDWFSGPSSQKIHPSYTWMQNQFTLLQE